MMDWLFLVSDVFARTLGAQLNPTATHRLILITIYIISMIGMYFFNKSNSKKLKESKSWDILYTTEVNEREHLKYQLKSNGIKSVISMIMATIFLIIIFKLLFMDNIAVMGFTILVIILTFTIFVYTMFIKKQIYNVAICDKGIIWNKKPLKWKSFNGYKIDGDKLVLYKKRPLEDITYCLNYNKELENIFKNYLNEIK
jgi:hypothetical protein